MTRDELFRFFKVYTDEIDRCLKGKCYWSMLSMVLTLPDICNTLQEDTDKGKKEKTRERYEKWCAAYLDTAKAGITAGELPLLRNKLLHQGITATSSVAGEFEFFTPNSGEHGKLGLANRRRIDVGILTEAILAAMWKWVDAVLEDPAILAIVTRDLNKLPWEPPTTPGVVRSDTASAIYNGPMSASFVPPGWKNFTP